MVAVRVDLHPLFDALAARDEGAITGELAHALENDNVAASTMAGRLAIPAALGDQSGDAVMTLVASGRLGDWMRVIPPGPEPGADRRRILRGVVPTASAALFANDAIRYGLDHQNPPTPEPLFPKDIPDKKNGWEALRDAVNAGDTETAGRVLMGFYGSGTDYREMIASLYFTICANFSADGLSLLTSLAATQALDFVDWGDRFPVFMLWLLPKLMQRKGETEGSTEVRAFLAQPAHDLEFLRTRLALTNKNAAGAPLRQAITRGTTANVVNEVFDALKRGANGAVVGNQICVAAAEYLATVPTTDAQQYTAAVNALRIANAARVAATQIQDIRVQPIVFYAANHVNQTIRAAGGITATPSAPLGGTLVGGLIEFSVLRNLERQLDGHDEGGARATVRRFSQMGFPGRSVMGTIGGAASRFSIAGDANGRGMLVVQAAGEAYLALTPEQQAAEGVALLDAAIHVVANQTGDTALAERIERVIGVGVSE